MMQVWDNIFSRPLWQKIVLWISTCLLATYITFSIFASDLFNQISELSEKSDQLESQVQIETAKIKKLPALRKDLLEYTELHEQALQRLPRKGQVEILLDAISDLAERSGLTVKIFTPRTEIKKQFYAEIPIDIEMKGNFQQIEVFLDELSHESRVVNVQDIRFDNPRGYKENAGVDVDVKAVFKTFRYLDPAERPQNVSDKDKKKV